MENTSYWQTTASHKVNPTFNQDQVYDIVIIGGGLTGIMCAYYLKDTNKKIAVFEKDEIGSQTSGHTTGKITFLHKTIYQFLIKYYGKEKAELYLRANQEAMQEIETIIHKHHIDCDYKKNRSFVYTTEQDNVALLEKEREALEQLNIPLLINEHQIKDAIFSIGVEDQAIFHPLKYLYQIVTLCKESGVTFFEHSPILNVKKKDNQYFSTCNGHIVASDIVVLATRYPQINFPGMYFLKLSQSREHIMFLESSSYLKDSYLSVDQVNKTYRPVLQHQLYGGYQKEVGKLDDLKFDISHDARKYFDFKTSMFWSAQDTKASRGIPYIGRFDKNNPSLYLACGFNKWGMTLSHVSGRIIHDLIMKQDNPYISLFKPNQKNIMASKKGMIQTVKQSIKGMVLNHFVGNDNLDSIFVGQGKVVRINGKLTGVYLDENYVYHYIHPICRHLKCVLSFNQTEKTWDCPCHGSRYDINGNLLEGPATSSLKK